MVLDVNVCILLVKIVILCTMLMVALKHLYHNNKMAVSVVFIRLDNDQQL